MLFLLLLAAFALGAASCAQPTPEAEEPTEPPVVEEEPVKVALILPGVITDAGWNAAAYEGLMAAKEQLGVETAYSESVPPPEYESTFRDYASQGYDLIIGHGSEYGDAALTVAQEFPDTYFAVTNAAVKAENVAGLDTKNEESGFMAGVVAGLASETKQVGYVGAMEILAMKRAEEGFKLGVEEVCPDCEVLVSYTGSFDDIAKGKEAALAMIDAGADVLFQYADASGLGVIEAAEEAGVMAIGSGGDQSELAPDHVITTTLQQLAPLITAIVKEVQTGTFQSNTIRLHGYDTGAYDLAPLNEDLLAEEEIGTILEYEQKLENGEVELPHLME
jgi:basic membrane protein A